VFGLNLNLSNIDKAMEVVGADLCGFNPRTANYYKNKTTHERLLSYNGIVNSNYPTEVIEIMNGF